MWCKLCLALTLVTEGKEEHARSLTLPQMYPVQESFAAWHYAGLLSRTPEWVGRVQAPCPDPLRCVMWLKQGTEHLNFGPLYCFCYFLSARPEKLQCNSFAFSHTSVFLGSSQGWWSTNNQHAENPTKSNAGMPLLWESPAQSQHQVGSSRPPNGPSLILLRWVLY